MTRPGATAFGAIVAIALLASPAAAQTPAPAAAPQKPAPAVEVNWGYSVFSVKDDESGETDTFKHTVLGGGARVPITSRLAVGGEILHLRGPGADRDWVFAGKLTFDLIPDTVDVPKPAVPYIVGAGGLLKHSDERNEVPIKVNTGFGEGGIGVRLSIGRLLYLAPEFRFGFETHWNIGLVVGIRPPLK
jgi:hypothetical protein